MAPRTGEQLDAETAHEASRLVGFRVRVRVRDRVRVRVWNRVRVRMRGELPAMATRPSGQCSEAKEQPCSRYWYAMGESVSCCCQQ